MMAHPICGHQSQAPLTVQVFKENRGGSRPRTLKKGEIHVTDLGRVFYTYSTQRMVISTVCLEETAKLQNGPFCLLIRLWMIPRSETVYLKSGEECLPYPAKLGYRL